MAQETDTEEVQSEQPPAESPKRRLRSSPESLRERKVRLDTRDETRADAKSKPTILKSFWRGFTWPLRQIGRGLARIGRLKPFRIIGKVLFPSYFRKSIQELRMVTWPNRLQSFRLTYAVIIFSVLFGAIIAVVDFALDKLFKEFIIK